MNYMYHTMKQYTINYTTMTKLHSTLEDIAHELQRHPQDQREEVLIQEIDTALIYTSDIWEYLNEIQPNSFELPSLGELARSPQELAFDLLYSNFYDRFGELLQEPEE